MVDVQLARDLANEIRLREKAEVERDRVVELLRQCLPALQGDEPEVIAAWNAVDAFLASLDGVGNEEESRVPREWFMLLDGDLLVASSPERADLQRGAGECIARYVLAWVER